MHQQHTWCTLALLHWPLPRTSFTLLLLTVMNIDTCQRRKHVFWSCYLDRHRKAMERPQLRVMTLQLPLTVSINLESRMRLYYGKVQWLQKQCRSVCFWENSWKYLRCIHDTGNIDWYEDSRKVLRSNMRPFGDIPDLQVYAVDSFWTKRQLESAEWWYRRDPGILNPWLQW